MAGPTRSPRHVSGGCTVDSTETHPKHPERPTVEADPAYDYSEDIAVDEEWDEEDDAIDEEERVVPLDVDDHREEEPEE
jgi:hypothetical protein